MNWTAVGIGVAIFVTLVGIIWKMLNDKIASHKSDCDKEIAKIWDQIGRDSSSGMRAKVHNSTSMGSHFELERRVHALEIKQAGER